MYIQDKDDRRGSVRFNFITDVIVRTRDGSKTLKGELNNLGIGGIALKTLTRLQEGTPCIVAIIIRDRYSQLVIKDVAGEVVRCGDGEMAIKFQHRFEWLALFQVYHAKSAV